MAPAYLRHAAAAACLATSLTCLGMPDPAAAAVRRVPSQYPTIRAGVQAAANGDTILVAPGTYTGQGNSSIDFDGKAIVVCSEAGPALTTIAPAVDQGAFIFESGEPPTAIVKGFTLRDGFTAIRCTESSPTVIDCLFYRNWGDYGAALLATDSSPTLIDCDFVENFADGGSGGAILVIRRDLALTNCTFTRNVAWGFGAPAGGGAVYFDGSGVGTVAISGCTFTDNIATASGFEPPWPGGIGGALALAGAGTVTDCTFVGNSATTGDPHSSDGFGGALSGRGPIVYRNCVFSGNSARLEGGAVSCYGGTFEHCTFSRNQALDGGAVFVTLGSSSRFVDCTFSDNQGDRGGVLAVADRPSLAVLERCLLLRNSARRGGAVHILESYVTLRSCTLFENAASDPEGGGAGVWIDTAGFESRVTIENSIIASSTQGQPVTCRGECCFVTMSCTDIFGNAGGDYVDCLSGLEGVDGNISEDPQFCDAPGGDFTLNAASACAPENAPPGCGLIGALDVGCGIVAIEDVSASPRVHLRVVPNPVRTTAAFTVGLEVDPWTLDIYDAQGRLLDGLRLSGAEGVWTPPKSAVNGVYFARLRGAGTSEIVKFLILR